MLSTFVLLILDEKRRGSSMGSNRNITVPTYLLGICPPHILYATRWVSLILPLESRCKSCVVYSSLTGTLMWDISCLIRALSSQRFTLLTLPFIHGLSLFPEEVDKSHICITCPLCNGVYIFIY